MLAVDFQPAQTNEKVTFASILILLALTVLSAGFWDGIRRLVRTGDPLRRFFDDVLARLSGPGRLRFILQPAVLLLAVRDGKRDAHDGP